MSEAIPLQTTWEDSICLVTLVPWWASECTARKTVFLSCVRITGLAVSWETSNSKEISPNLTGCTTKEEDDNVLMVSAQEI
jgi:hypothetical protein